MSHGKGLVAALLTAALLLGNLPALLGYSPGAVGSVGMTDAAAFASSCTRTATLTSSVSSSSGGAIAVTGAGFIPFEPVTVYFNSAVPMGGADQGSNPVQSPTTVVDANGNLSTSLTIGAAPVPNSQYTISAVGTGGSCAATVLRVPIATAGLIGTDVLTVSSISQTVLVTSSIIPSNASQNVSASIDTASSGNYFKTQVSPVAVPAVIRLDVSTAGYTAFQVTVPGALSFNVHSLVINATVSGGPTYSDAVGLRYQQVTPAAITATSPSGVASGTMMVSGVGFAGSTAGSAVPITITMSGAGQVFTPTNTSPVQTSISGTFAVTFPVPNLGNGAGGVATVKATDAVGTVATTSFIVQPLSGVANTASLTVVPLGGNACTPATGTALAVAPNQGLVVVLSGYGPSELVPVVVAGLTLATLTTDQSGSANATIPFTNTVGNAAITPANGLPSDRGVAPTTYILSAVGATSGRIGTQTVSTCATALSVASSNVAPGAGQTITATGFAAGEVISVISYLASSSSTLTTSASAVFTATANAAGQATGIFTAPATFNTYTLRAQGSTTGLVATTNITTTLTSVTSLNVPVTACSTFSLVASGGFNPGEVVTITPQGGSTVTATVTSQGSFVATLTAPANSAATGLPITIVSTRGTAVVSQPITVPVAALSLAPATVASGGSTLVNGSGFIPSSAVTLTTEFQSNGQSGPAGGQSIMATASSTGAFTATLPVSPTVLVVGGGYQVRATSACAVQNTATAPITVTGLSTGGVANGGAPTTTYFAEGYTGRAATNGKADFDESISVLNPDAVAKTVTFTYQVQGQTAPIVVSTQVAPNADVVRSVNADVGNDRIVSAIVSASGRIIAQRVIDRSTSAGRLDSSSSLGTTSPSANWYFAEGYTGATFQEYLTVANPAAVTATVTVTFLPQGTAVTPPLSTTFTVSANGRATENIRADYLKFRGNPNKSVGMIVTSNQSIVAERVMYWGDGNGSAKFGAGVDAGLANPSTQFYFAYGSHTGTDASNVTSAAQTPNDESYVTVVNANPSSGSPATVLVSFFDGSGHPIGSKSVTVAPQTRQTVVVNNVIPTVKGPFYTQVTSDQPIFVEKPQYIGGSPNIGKHPGFAPAGVPGGQTTVLFPNLSTATSTGTAIQQSVFLLNTGSTTIMVTGLYYAANGQTASVPYTIGAGQVVVVNVNADTITLPVGALGAQYSTSSGQLVATSVSNTSDQLSYWATQGAGIR